jgi:hypothetical protein
MEVLKKKLQRKKKRCRKICLFKSYYMPILMYRAETWTCTMAAETRYFTKHKRKNQEIK